MRDYSSLVENKYFEVNGCSTHVKVSFGRLRRPLSRENNGRLVHIEPTARMHLSNPDDSAQTVAQQTAPELIRQYTNT